MSSVTNSENKSIGLPLVGTTPVSPAPQVTKPVIDGNKPIWRSLDDLADTPEFRTFARQEFPGFANVYEGLNEVEVKDVSLSRRQFIALSAAGLGLAGLVGCRRPDLQILPYSQTPDHVVPGVPLFYATSIPRPGGSFPVLVESHEGRPTKIEGNPRHPFSMGSTDTHAQASVLDLYSADRSRDVLNKGKASSWEAFDREVGKLFGGEKGLRSTQGEGLHFLVEDVNSPALRLLREHMDKVFAKAVWHVYEAVDQNNVRRGAEMVFGKPFQVSYQFAKAKRILSLDADFLGQDPNAVANARGFAESRRVPDHESHDHGHDHGHDHKHDHEHEAVEHAHEVAEKLSRLYVVESNYSVTGTMADHRLRLPSSHVVDYVIALAKYIAEKKGADAALKSALAAAPVAGITVPKEWIEAVADDLLDKHFAGKAVVLAGYRQPAIVHALAFAINQMLGSIGEIVKLWDVPVFPSQPIGSLVQAINDGKAKTVVIIDGNPVYNAPAELGFDAAIGKVPTVIRLGMFADETSAKATWHVPTSHYLESWGDAETLEGVHGIVQPLVAPLFNTRSALECLIHFSAYDDVQNFSEAKNKVYDLLQKSFAARSGIKADDAGLKAAFDAFIQKGFIENSERKAGKVDFNSAKLVDALKAHKAPSLVSESSMEVSFFADYSVYDGRYATNGWLMEWPDPITKLVWDNAALVSMKTGQKLGVKNGDILEIEANGSKVKVPAFILPGHADHSVSLLLGYGKAGTEEKLRIRRIPSGGGFNVYPIRSTNQYFTVGKVTRTGETYQLVTTQEHGTIQTEKMDDIIHDYSVEQYEMALHEHASHGKEGGEKGDHGGHHKDDPKTRFQYGYEVSSYKVVENNKGYDAEQTQIKKEGLQTAMDISFPARLDGHMQWGMVVDLNTCTGCSACVIACQAENNIPIVGKDEVRRNREMHWIRLDRYFTGDPSTIRKGVEQDPAENPRIITQPMMCQQCEAAPCESVCPVNASVHSPEGLNLQVYNRCIGTRYCSNNCPYKVRRFNWFDFNKRHLDQLRVPTPVADGGVGFSVTDGVMPETLKMQKNPEVTVRMRGVMEKCTYCIQRIERAKIGSKVLAAKAGMDKVDAPVTTSAEQEYKLGYGVRQYGGQSKVIVPDGVITPACAQACPSKAIVFGNVNDKNSKVYKLKNRHAADDYLVLGLLNTKPRTSYLPRLRNLNEKMKEATA